MSGHSQPLIAIPANSFPYEDHIRHGVQAQYLAAALDVAGVTPLLVPALGEKLDIAAILDSVDGILITGARSNVHPAHYGEAETAAHAPFDPGRDATTLPLIRMALARGIPLLAICRGMQELNVALGGTLLSHVQELPGRDDHRAPENALPDERYTLRQKVSVRKNSRLAAIVGAGDILVNSVHEQAIGELAPAVTVEATAPDGTIEAISVRDAKDFALGLQWHPEYWATSDKPSNAIFKSFGAAVYNCHARKTSPRNQK
ncbi:MAG: Glutamine amidotransferase, class I [Candidatus Tokpelaia hoelldobleri]|uniref:gamma-glutamyl-gamma-aminobutyrate hydrolase n=1 Tax=Candidatus Tokpelaia hoelldobleri TaxID=1902579 RepID=A0A1U9JW99_9HYPH|nr:MAG: Glutamine amidotransferase, class I [Candidatus Tokpelaia hoelldoblerii]